MTSRPPSVWRPSPNFTKREHRDIICVVLHATGTLEKEKHLDLLCDKNSRNSVHYFIDFNGDIYQLVHEKDIAWHAGESSFNGISGVNEFSIGIEFLNPNDGTLDYPYMQIRSAVDLIYEICKDNEIALGAVVGHADIAPAIKHDPKYFPWIGFKSSLRSKGIQ